MVGTILPPPAAAQATAPAANGPATTPEPATTLNGQSQIVILALSAQQAELVRFTQLDGNLSLVLRSPKDKDAPAVKTDRDHAAPAGRQLRRGAAEDHPHRAALIPTDSNRLAGESATDRPPTVDPDETRPLRRPQHPKEPHPAIA